MLLVVCQDRATAEWADRPVSFGPPQWPLLTLRPLVAGPHNMPLMTDPSEVRKDLALATLATITHGKNPDIGAVLKAVTTALVDTPDAVKNPVIEFISQGLGKLPAAALWRKLVAVDLSFFKSPLVEEIRDEARVEGRVEGRAEGETRRAAEDVLTVLAERGIDVPEEARERITECGDPEVLGRWLRRAVTAPTAEDVFRRSSRLQGGGPTPSPGELGTAADGEHRHPPHPHPATTPNQPTRQHTSVISTVSLPRYP